MLPSWAMRPAAGAIADPAEAAEMLADIVPIVLEHALARLVRRATATGADTGKQARLESAHCKTF